jgi:hypothetical protein
MVAYSRRTADPTVPTSLQLPDSISSTWRSTCRPMTTSVHERPVVSCDERTSR